MQINGHTRVFMILGDPVAQVRAPEMFNHLFRRHGVAAVLVPAHVAAADFVAFATQVLKARNIDGLWLTIPHKSTMLPLLDRCDRLGQVAGAVNAVRRNADGGLEGALFDGLGFVKALDVWGVSLPGASALVVGAGGAGVAIAVSLAERGVARLDLFDLDPARADAVAARIRAAWPIDVRVAASADPAGFDLIVNASPLGLKSGDALPFDPARVAAGAAVADILMKQATTPLLQACHARGHQRAWPGHEMMIQQAPEYLAYFGLHELARVVQEDASEVRRMLLAD